MKAKDVPEREHPARAGTAIRDHDAVQGRMKAERTPLVGGVLSAGGVASA